MLIANADYKNSAKQPIQHSRVVVTQVGADVPFEYTSDDDIVSIKMDSVGLFLGTATKKMTINLLNIHNDFRDAIVEVKLGLENFSDGSYDYVNLGTFSTDTFDIDYEAETTSVTLYDGMWKATRSKYINTGLSNFDYPATVEELAGAVAEAIGVTLMDDFDLLPNSGHIIEQDPYEQIDGVTMRDVINEIAQATATTAIISGNTLKFVQFNLTDEVMTSDNLKKLKVGGHYGTLNSLVLARVPQEDNEVMVGGATAEMEVTAVDTTDNLLTIEANEMNDGTIVKLKTTDTMPAPLVANTKYYVFTDGDPDTFSLHTSYADSLDGSNPIDITTAGTGTLSTIAIPLTEFKIANNEILDDDRETLIVPIFESIYGLEFDGVDAKTEGHGWYEVGDVITITQGADSYVPFITEIHLTADGSISEQIICEIPDPTKTNYATAGGIMKTIYNTELKTDRQNQQIIATVEQINELGEEIDSNYSQVIQTINEITNTFQTTGGNNFIQNSVGYATETDGSITFWDLTGTGSATANSSPESLNYGAVSGNQINLTGASPKLTQRVLVQAGGKYSIGFRVKKEATGSAVVRLVNDTDLFEIDILDGTAYLWNSMSMVAIEPTMGYFDVEIESDGAVGLSITDLMLVTGESTTVWQQANGEILNTQVSLNSEGIKVKSSIYEGDFTQMTPLEFAGYSSVSGTQERVFGLNRDITFTKKLQAEDQITMPPIKIVPVMEGANAGWVFVAVGEED